MSTITGTRRILASLGAAAALATTVLVAAPAAQAATAGACDLSPTLSTTLSVYNGSTGALDLPSDNEANGQRVGVYTANQSPAQTWSFWGYCDGTYAISHGGAGKVLDLDSRSGAVQLWDTPGGWDGLNRPAGDWMPANQKWLMTDEDRGWYLIRNAATGQCLKGNGIAQYTSVTSCNGNDPAQRWYR
ncbi:RICIN domain-containing protein [Streptomyces sp. FH025]|uniref:RICIN domain-containing protein n=1 Tax=Streptomyces sp. FH025 TaxID=2815937 RepID=UPI001A9F5FC3|nr:RICIN domain-containing protein [Streptomyces sp. FH025]MBO1415960.1 RICIN domain-containing protein [Streptomyces sp. FH025]